MKNKQKYSLEDDCIVCLEKKKVIPYDCFGHNFCERCYYELDKCPICRIEKHPIMSKKL